MPIYESKCEVCGKRQDYYQTVANYLVTPDCCGEKTKRVISTPMLQASTFRVFEAYESPSTGKIVKSFRERDADMKSSNCREWEGLEQEKKEAARIKQYEDEQFDRQVDTWVDDAYRELPSDLKEAVQNPA